MRGTATTAANNNAHGLYKFRKSNKIVKNSNLIYTYPYINTHTRIQD